MRAHLGVAFVSAAPKGAKRTVTVVDLAEAAVPVLLGFAVQDIRGSTLYTPALHRKGLGAFVVMGHRDVELSPAHPAAVRPVAVDAIDGTGGRSALWRRSA